MQTPRNVPLPGKVPFFDPTKLTIEQLLKMAGDNPIKRMYWAAQQWAALKRHATLHWKIETNLAAYNAEQAAEAEAGRPRHDRMAPPMIDENANGVDDREEGYELPKDTDEDKKLSDNLRHYQLKSHLAAIYSQDYIETINAMGIDEVEFREAMYRPISEEEKEAHAAIKANLVEILLASPRGWWNRWLLDSFADRLAAGLLRIGVASVDRTCFVHDFEAHVDKMESLSKEFGDMVEDGVSQMVKLSHRENKPMPEMVPEPRKGPAAPEDVIRNLDDPTGPLPDLESGEWQVAYIKTMYPDLPKSPEAQKKSFPTPKPSPTAPKDDRRIDSREELKHYSRCLQMKPETLFQSATAGVTALFGVPTPKLAGEEKQKSMMQREMDKMRRPTPPGEK